MPKRKTYNFSKRKGKYIKKNNPENDQNEVECTQQSDKNQRASSIIGIIPSIYLITSNGDLKSEQQSDNMEQDDIVKVEETTINLDCIKKELDEGEFEFDENQYKPTLSFQNIFGENSKKLRDNKDTLIGFLDEEVVMETGCIKLEDVKDEEDLRQEIMEQSGKQQSDNMEQDDIVKVEETTINLDCIKKELDEGEFDENQYKLTLSFQNIFGESSKELRDNKDSLIGFLDEEVVMETGCIKLEDVKEEEDLIQEIMEQSDCNKCGGSYEGYCPRCSSLSHILNNLTPNINSDPILNTTPVNMLEIREVSTGQAVFALKTLPKGIILGPFQGTAPIKSTNGLKWKIKDRKFVNDQNGNWMKYIGSVANDTSKNLDVYQFGGVLYFETSREIQEGEELLVCYREEKDKVFKSNSKKEFYLIPVKKEKYPKVFACTLCCLGFRLEMCLVEHKSKCPQGDHGGSIEDFEIVQCRCCKVWLEKQEHLERHLLHCLDNYNRMSHGASQPIHRKEVNAEAIEDRLNTKGVHEGFKCSQCSYETSKKKNLEKHLDTHKKPFQCDICMMNFTLKSSIRKHKQNKHTDNGRAKKYQCSDCSFVTIYKSSYQSHLNMHNNVKPFECGICKMKYTNKKTLQEHIMYKHTRDGCAKDYQCLKCSFQTSYKKVYENHLIMHSGIKAFECGICQSKYTSKRSLKMHIKNKHIENTRAKDYQCSDCSFQTNYKIYFQNHVNLHSGIKPFECAHCEMKFAQKRSLKMHIKNKHTDNGCAKDYQCSDCSFQTNKKYSYQRHLQRHSKLFECGICKMKCTLKSDLRDHVKRKHV